MQDLAAWRLCLGCGACAYICPEKNLRLLNVEEEGIRPQAIDPLKCQSCCECLQVCPAYENDHRHLNAAPGLIPELIPACGPVLEIWEGHASDPEIRLAGASGGVLTALALHGLAQRGMHGILHIADNPQDPLRNQTMMSRNRDDLLSKTGSRYAPASACDSLHRIETAGGPCVFIGQPSEVTALRKAQRLRSGLDRKVGLALSFFCAGSPASAGTLDLIHKLGVDPIEVGQIRYRGQGWPGMFSITLKGQSSPAAQMTYQDSWAFLQKYRPYSTHLCPDGTGEDADISCGDPWYRRPQDGEPGSSLIVVRTELGREMLRSARESGSLQLQPSDPEKVLLSQPGLVAKRSAVGGRLLAFRILGLPTPRLQGFNLYRNWVKLPFDDKIKSTLGTLRRIIQRKYYRPRPVQPQVHGGELAHHGRHRPARLELNHHEIGEDAKRNRNR